MQLGMQAEVLIMRFLAKRVINALAHHFRARLP